MNKKYEILPEPLPIGPNGENLFQVKALEDFGNVQKGNLGGYVRNAHNLSQNGICWIHIGVRVHEDATVSEAAQMYGGSASGTSIITDQAQIFGTTHICGSVQIRDLAKVTGGIISENARILNLARVVGPVIIRKDAIISCCQDYLCIGMVAGDKFFTAFRCKTGYKIAMDKFIGTVAEFMDAALLPVKELVHVVALCEARFT